MADRGSRRRLGRGIGALMVDSPAGPDVAPAEPVSVTAESPANPAGPTHAVPPASAEGQSPPSEVSSSDVSGSDDAAPAVGRVLDVRLDRLQPSPFQPRRVFDAAELQGLAESIHTAGVMQPILVRVSPGEAGSYEIVAGERRWRAAKLAGIERVPVLVRELDDRTSAEWALVENLQRSDLNAIERAEALRGLMDRFGLTQQAVADRVGIERSSVANLVRLMELEPALRDLVAGGALSAGHGKALLAAPPGDPRIALARVAVRESWSVRQLETRAKAALSGELSSSGNGPDGGDGSSSGGAKSGVRPPRSAEMDDLERRLGEHLGTRVRISLTGASRGSLTVSFFDLDHFDGVLSRMGYHGDAI